MAIKHKIAKVVFKLFGIANCQEFDASLYDYSENNLSEKLHRSIRHHLRICKPCMRILESYQKLRDLMRGDHAPKLADATKKHLKENF